MSSATVEAARRRRLIRWLVVAAALAGLLEIAPRAGAAAPSITSVTIRSSANPAKASKRVVVTGRVIGKSVRGARVTLWQRLAGQRRFRAAGHAVAAGSGAYTVAFRPGVVSTSREWYASAGRRRSAVIEQRVQATVSLAASAT